MEQRTNTIITKNIIKALHELPNTRKIEPSYKWLLVKDDPDDDKYMDCAVAANADDIISNDRHFDVLEKVEFPKSYLLEVISS